jgi:nitrogen regulatory protein PII
MSSSLHIRKLLTIICESTLEEDIAEALVRHGARGHTVTDARGRGTHGLRDGSWSAGANVRIEVLCDEATARELLTVLEHDYFADYYMVAFLSDVQVLRPGKF